MSSTAAHAPGDVHVVLVSTVVALAPSRDRAYYSGFKNLAEVAVADAFRGLAWARLSVVHPGHPSASSSSASLTGRLATPYAALARLLLKMSGSSTASSRVVGLDARLWLFTRMLFLLSCALAPGWRSMPIPQRDGLLRH